MNDDTWGVATYALPLTLAFSDEPPPLPYISPNAPLLTLYLLPLYFSLARKLYYVRGITTYIVLLTVALHYRKSAAFTLRPGPTFVRKFIECVR